MSWSFYATGTKEKVIERLKLLPKPSGFSPAEDVGFETGRNLLIANILEIKLPDVLVNPWDCNGVKVEFFGHGGTSSSSMTIRADPVRLEI